MGIPIKTMGNMKRKGGIELNCFAATLPHPTISCQATETNDISLQLGFWHFIKQGE